MLNITGHHPAKGDKGGLQTRTPPPPSGGILTGALRPFYGRIAPQPYPTYHRLFFVALVGFFRAVFSCGFYFFSHSFFGCFLYLVFILKSFGRFLLWPFCLVGSILLPIQIIILKKRPKRSTELQNFGP